MSASAAAGTGIHKPKNLSPELQAIVGPGPMSRPAITRGIWDYIKEHNLKNPANKQMIVPDEKLKKVFGGQSEIHMMQIAKHVSAHVS